MSTKDIAYSIFSRLSEEQLKGFHIIGMKNKELKYLLFVQT